MKGGQGWPDVKRPVALFEVIHRDKRFAPKPPPPLQRPAVAIPRPPSATAAPVSPAQSKPPISVGNCALRSHTAAVSGPPFYQILVERAFEFWRGVANAMTPRLQQLKRHVQPHYPILAGAAAAFVIIGVVATARHLMHRTDTSASALASLQQIRQQARHPEVMEVAVQTHPTAPLADAPSSPGPDATIALAQSADSVLPPAPRQVNLNYVLVQSYGDQKTASEACDFLNHNGIPCTIERGVKNWRKDFYLVIGLQGFTRVSGPDYVAYRTRIEALSAQFASPHSYYKGFAPQAIKWDRAD